ncbi:putative UPF0481 protein At3g02645 [Solanum verrucosum]|uniref:putative UPF0481 protein At3g02645 n=1 Tax=Solanum verrucosum TaxID=315347 RepID=UPI0020D12F91|nr:putative UPF0481 protein At3g02645 [Solanum verrucosum]
MTHSTGIIPTDDQIPLIPQINKDKIIKGRIDEMFEDLNNSSIKSHTIFKVNVSLRESNPEAYAPKMISIGPYHKNNPQLRSMEKYKLLYLQRFLERKKELDVKSYISELQKLKAKALKSYDDIDNPNNDSNEFCEMLLLDGCFVVEFIRERSEIYPKEEEEIIKSNIGCIRNQIVRDLMLLENQLPFFILNKLHDMTKQEDESPLAIQAVLSFTFFVDLDKVTGESLIKVAHNAVDIKHLLHAVHILSCHGNPTKNSFDDTTCHTVMPNATELSEAGVSFAKVKNNSYMTSLFNIKFKDGLMTIPCFQVIEETESFLRNLIAYEQQSCEVQPKYFSDFAVFMDYLIDSDKDVNLLRQKGIIKHWMGEDKDVSSFFNKIGKGVTRYSTFYYEEECLSASQHCKKKTNRLIANLMRNYCSGPWVGASTAAAIILLLLTAIQTILAIISAFKVYTTRFLDFGDLYFHIPPVFRLQGPVRQLLYDPNERGVDSMRKT